jgi:hypothetical protein
VIVIVTFVGTPGLATGTTLVTSLASGPYPEELAHETRANTVPPGATANDCVVVDAPGPTSAVGVAVVVAGMVEVDNHTPHFVSAWAPVSAVPSVAAAGNDQFSVTLAGTVCANAVGTKNSNSRGNKRVMRGLNG